MNPIVPESAIGKPITAAVPIAWSIGTLHQSMKGTVMNAPPIAANAESALTRKPKTNIPAKPGGAREGLGLRSSRRWVAAMVMTAVKSAAKSTGGMKLAIHEPTRPPARMPGVTFLAMSQRMAPRAACARTLATEVKRMVAIAVPTARCRIWDFGRPCDGDHPLHLG